MARRTANAVLEVPPAAPTAMGIVEATPAPTLITPPDAIGFFAKFQEAVAPLLNFQVVDNETFIAASRNFTQVADFIEEVDKAFAPARDAAYASHRAICALEGMFTKPAIAVKANLATQQLNWKNHLEMLRIQEEQRLQREREVEMERLRKEKIRELESERQRQIAEAEIRMPWEDATEPPPPITELEFPIPDLPPVRLPSTVPVVFGGSAFRNKPWAYKLVDFKKLVIEAGKRAEAGDDSLLACLQVEPRYLTLKARELTTTMKDVIPGVEAVQEQTVARG